MTHHERLSLGVSTAAFVISIISPFANYYWFQNEVRIRQLKAEAFRVEGNIYDCPRLQTILFDIVLKNTGVWPIDHVSLVIQKTMQTVALNQKDFKLTSFSLEKGDIAAIVRPGLDGIILPKVESAGGLATVGWLLAQTEREHGLVSRAIELIPIIETARGLNQIDAIQARRFRRRRFHARCEHGVEPQRGRADLCHPCVRVVAGGVQLKTETIDMTHALGAQFLLHVLEEIIEGIPGFRDVLHLVTGLLDQRPPDMVHRSADGIRHTVIADIVAAAKVMCG
jgi:HpcH/HpaI aldolase/citrate lyase family protein